MSAGHRQRKFALADKIKGYPLVFRNDAELENDGTMPKAFSVVTVLLLTLAIGGRIQAENAIPSASIVDYTTLALPPVGTNTLHVLTLG